MKRKVISTFLAIAMVASMTVGCGNSSSSGYNQKSSATVANSSNNATTATTNTATRTVIGLSMPTQSSERWINDAANMKVQLEAAGYIVTVEFAGDDSQEQVSQIEKMMAKEVDCLVIAAVDSGALTAVEAQAKEAGIPIIAYDRLLMDTDAVSYYATFDNKGVGTEIAEYIVEAKDLEAARAAGKSYTIEFFMGSPDDNNALFLYNGVMEVLKPYLDDGTLVCKTGRTSFEETCVLRWSQETAQQRCENYLAANYANEKVDILCTAYDGLAYGCKAALEGAGYTVDENWPLITGQDAELMAIKNIISGSQTMSIYKDTSFLAQKCVTMVDAVLKGSEPEINDAKQYSNGVITVPAYLCTPVAVDQSNYKELLVDTKYYTEEQLEK